MWEDRQLRDISEADIRQVVNSGLREHLQLEFKGELYGQGHRDARESLLDICMFANAAGGILLIGVPERRDVQGQPTGSPDPVALLGIDVPNPEMVLQAMDARVVASVEERLTIESFAVPIAGGRHVLAIRVPNSQAKPHSVHLEGHIYFPSRRERNRYAMDVREIKEMVMRTASRLEQAEEKLRESFLEMPRLDTLPYLLIGCIPIFTRDFIVDVRNAAVINATGKFFGGGTFRQPKYSFNGLERPVANDGSVVQVRRNGLIVLDRVLPTQQQNDMRVVFPQAIDQILRKFVIHAAEVYNATALTGPYLLGMMLRPIDNLVPGFPFFPDDREAFELGAPIGELDRLFPVMQADNLTDVDKIIRPLCDQVHQTFAKDASPCFNADGAWIGPA
jgi:hypothetical protein